MLTPREKSSLVQKISSEEDRTHDATTSRTASPTHYQPNTQTQNIKKIQNDRKDDPPPPPQTNPNPSSQHGSKRGEALHFTICSVLSWCRQRGERDTVSPESLTRVTDLNSQVSSCSPLSVWSSVCGQPLLEYRQGNITVAATFSIARLRMLPGKPNQWSTQQFMYKKCTCVYIFTHTQIHTNIHHK